MKDYGILKMSIKELGFLVSNWMEPKPLSLKTYAELDHEDGGNYTNWKVLSPKGWWEIFIDYQDVCSHQMFEVIPDWNIAKDPANDIELAFQVEEKVVNEGLRIDYVQALQKVVVKDKIFFSTFAELFQLIHATPEDRCRAAMIVVMNKEEACKNESQ